MEENTKKEASTKVEISLLSAFNIKLEGFSSEQVMNILEKLFNVRGLIVMAILLVVVGVIKTLNH